MVIPKETEKERIMIVGDVWDTREGPKRALKTITLGSDIVGYNYTDTKNNETVLKKKMVFFVCQ